MESYSKFYMIKKCCKCGIELEKKPCDMENHLQVTQGFCASCLDNFRKEIQNRKLAPLIIVKHNIENKTVCVSQC